MEMDFLYQHPRRNSCNHPGYALCRRSPWIKATLANLKKLDYIGLGLLTVAMGGMQIMLDKGEENDWLSSNFIRVFALLFAAGMLGLIWREWQSKDPIMNLKLFKFKNFAICAFLMMLVGGVLNASTVLQPQFSQQLLGYTATLAGKALTGGGLILLVLAPLSGVASESFQLVILPSAASPSLPSPLLQLHPCQLVDEFRLWFLAADAAGGSHPLCFIAITNAAYMGLPKEASNQVSGIINFARNVEAASLSAVTGAIVTNRSLFHQNRLADHMQAGNTVFTQRINELTNVYAGVSGGQGTDAMARGQIYSQLNRQASAMGYVDVYRLLGWMAVG